MSSPAGLRGSQADFLARWMPGSTRAGVVLGPGPDLAEGSPSLGGPDDSFASDFAPLPGSSVDSSYLGVDGLNRSPAVQKAGTEGPESGQSSDGELEDLDGLPIRAKLEQLRKWQQHMQEQLKAHQLEELLRLQDEQQRLLGMMNGSQRGPEDDSEASGRCDSRETPPSCPVNHHADPRLEPGVQDCEEVNDEEDGEEEVISRFHERDDTLMPRNGGGALSEDVYCERPIQPGVGGRKTFEELLEEQLRLEEQRLKSARQQQSHGGVQAVHAAPKRAFLKRGEGLSRFTTNRKASLPKTGPKKDVQARAVCRRNSEPAAIQRGGVGVQRVAVQRKTATLNKENRPRGLGSPPPDVRPESKAVPTKVLGRNQRQNTEAPEVIQSDLEEGRRPGKLKERNARNAELNRAQQPGGGPQDSFEWSFQEKLQRWHCDRQLENVELGEFELLEQAAEELSFSSNSSFVLKVLQMDQQHRGLDPRRLSSTPIKLPPGGGAGSERESVSDAFAAPTRSEDSDGSTSGGAEFEEREATAFCFPSPSNPPYDKRSYQDEESGEDSEASDETQVADVGEDGGTDESTLNEEAVKFDDVDTWNEPEDAAVGPAPETRTLTRKVAVSRAVEEEEEDPAPALPLPPASQLMTRLFPSLKPKAQNAPLHPPPVAPESKKSEETTGQQLASRQLRERLVELELEIERFKKENAAVSRLRQENQRNQELLGKERSAYERLKAEQQAEWEELKREESRKLQKERRLFERHAAAARAGPDKKEREEIQVLKQQLGALQEELKGRESRWAAAHSRLRQQVDSLSRDNDALRDQITMLEKLRLSSWRKPPTDAERDKEAKDPRTSEGSTSVTKGVKFASPLDSRGGGGSSVSPPQSSAAAATRRSSHGAAAGMKSSLRRPSAPCLPSSSSLPGRRAGERLSPASRNQELSVSPRNESLPNEPEGGEEREPESAKEEVRPSEEETSPSEEEVRPPPDGKVETLLTGGERLVVFTNGTKKEVSADGQTVKITFFNGDTKEVTADQRVIYFYANTQTTHVTFPDGVEVLHFPNNQTEKHFPDGRKEIVFPDQTVKNLFPGGREESVLTDGTVIQVSPDGTKEILFNTGQKEVHTAGFKRREYPDGTAKTVYADGRQETRYPNGRLRVKDRHGHVVLDSGA
ncbi:centromere protein J [Clinocottus analis]|uniref:centromere protein J n=1 Tax=Clinocottus analis TaxID=304258 RepID=UPI0035BF14BD